MDSWRLERTFGRKSPLICGRGALTVATAGGASGRIRGALIKLINIIRDNSEREWLPPYTRLVTCPTSLL
jgi:hypothetical protein